MYREYDVYEVYEVYGVYDKTQRLAPLGMIIQ